MRRPGLWIGLWLWGAATLVWGYSYFYSDYGFVGWLASWSWYVSWIGGLMLLVRFIFSAYQQINLALFSVLFSLLLLESVLRLLGIGATVMEQRSGSFLSQYKPQEQDWLHVWTPNANHRLQNQEYDYARTSNSLGLSDREWSVAKDTSVFRIIGIGDSFTEGDGAPADSSWPALLNEMLHSSSVQAEVLNAGVCGSDPFFGYQLLKEKLMAYHPDLVILTVNNSDIDDYLVRGGMERFLKNGSTVYQPHPWHEYWYAVSYLNRLWMQPLMKLDHNLLPEEVSEKRRAEAVIQISALMKQADRLCRKNGIRFWALVHPLKFEYLDGHYYALDPLVKQLAKDSVEYVDFLKAYQQDASIDSSSIADYYWIKDAHHNSRGYALMASKLKEKILSGSILP